MNIGVTKMLLFAVGLYLAVVTVAGQDSQNNDISYRGKRLSEWVASFDKGIPREQRSEAVKAVQSMGTKAVPGLKEMLSDSSPRDAFTRDWRALHAIIYLGPAAESLVPTLVELYGKSDREIRIQTMVALCSIGKEPEKVLPEIQKMLQRVDERERAYVPEIISTGFSSDRELVIPILEQLQRDESEKVREQATIHLERIRQGQPKNKK